MLKRALSRAADQGFTFYTHPEVEFYLFDAPADPTQPLVPVDQGGYFDHVPRGTAHDFRRAAITMLESMGISVEFSPPRGRARVRTRSTCATPTR